MSRFPVARIAVPFALVALASLALLAYFSLSLADDAVRREVERRISSSAALSAEVVREEMAGLAELVDSYAQRPSLADALTGRASTRADARRLRRQLSELRRDRTGIYTTFVVNNEGVLLDTVPAEPALVGNDYSFRDWFQGVTRTGRPYISQAYQSDVTGKPFVVAAAAPVRSPGGRQVGIIVAAYDFGHLQELVDGFSAAQGIRLKIADQTGTVLADPGRPIEYLLDQRGDPRIEAALRGKSGILELNTQDGRRLSAYVPVAGLGWAVTASVPSNTAFAAVADLRSTVLAIAAVLTLVLLAGLALLFRALRSRRRAEERAQRLAGINSAVLDATPAAILLVDSAGRTLIENAAHRALLAQANDHYENVYERAEAAAERFVNVEEYRAAISGIASDPERVLSLDLEARDGRAFHVFSGPVREERSGQLGRIFVIRDQSAEREAERLKSELVATISHELRTPLASILGYAELLSERRLDAPVREAYVSTIYGEAKRLTALINDFLDLQRIEAGSFSLSLESFSLRDLLQQQIELFSAQSDRHTIELETGDGPLDVLADRIRVAQVVANLVSNAIKYSPQGGSIVVAAETGGNGLRVSVRDQGLGIPADQQRQLFTKFFRVDTSDTREIGGTGLGLALCREIVDAHGGRIGFETVEGEGSTFWFQLPVRSTRNDTGPQRVLVVEDDPAAAELLAEYLASDGHTVELVATGEQALVRAEQDPPAAICLDIVLGGELDGWEVLARLKASPATSSIPVIICTGRNGRANAAALRAANFLAKPFTQRELREAIARVLPGRSGSVLVVDDEESVRNLVRESLRGNGYRVREAADGGAALDEISEEKPDIVVLDLIMPGLDGFAVLERLQEAAETRDLPVIVLTAKRLSEEERDRLLVRSAALLEKTSYSASELRRVVRRAVSK